MGYTQTHLDDTQCAVPLTHHFVDLVFDSLAVFYNQGPIVLLEKKRIRYHKRVQQPAQASQCGGADDANL